MADIAEEIAANVMAEAELPQDGQPPAEAAPNVESQTPAPQPAQEQSPERPEPGFVPIQGLLEEREKRQKAEREASELRQWRQQQEAQRQAPKVPDPYEDPNGWAQHQDQKLEQAKWDSTRTISFNFASKEHGIETLGQAESWAQQQAARNPLFEQEFQRQQDPYGWLVTQFKRDRLLNEIGDDPDAYARRRYAEMEAGSALNPPVPAQAGVITPKPAPPPRSLAAAPGSNLADAQPKDVFGGLKFKLD